VARWSGEKQGSPLEPTLEDFISGRSSSGTSVSPSPERIPLCWCPRRRPADYEFDPPLSPTSEIEPKEFVDQRFLSPEQPIVSQCLAVRRRGQCGTHHALNSPNVVNPSCYAFAQASSSDLPTPETGVPAARRRRPSQQAAESAPPLLGAPAVRAGPLAAEAKVPADRERAVHKSDAGGCA
jgi:hypothetical protein